MVIASTNRPPTSIARRPIRSDREPPIAEATPHEVAVKDTRLATSPTLTPRSWLISIRNGARVVPLEVAAKDPRQAAPIRAHGMVRVFIPAALIGRSARRAYRSSHRRLRSSHFVVESRARPLEPAASRTEFTMQRRTLIKLAGGLLMSTTSLPARAEPYRRVRPGEAGWPAEAQWKELDGQIGGRLIAVPRPLDDCRANPKGADCESLFRSLKNPWAIGDSPVLTQTSGWADAWASTPSAYAVPARSAADVAAAVNFARSHRLRVAVKGGGH